MKSRTESLSFLTRPAADPRHAITREVREVLEEMFTQTGMETVVYYLKINYDVTLSDASDNPKEFQDALAAFLGDFGSKLLLKRIVNRLMRLGGQAHRAPERTWELEEVVKIITLPDVTAHRSIPPLTR